MPFLHLSWLDVFYILQGFVYFLIVVIGRRERHRTKKGNSVGLRLRGGHTIFPTLKHNRVSHTILGLRWGLGG